MHLSFPVEQGIKAVDLECHCIDGTGAIELRCITIWLVFERLVETEGQAALAERDEGWSF